MGIKKMTWKEDAAFDRDRATSGLALVSRLTKMMAGGQRFGQAVFNLFRTADLTPERLFAVENVDLERKLKEKTANPPRSWEMVYVCQAYTNFPGGVEEAFLCASRRLKAMFCAGVVAFSPIVHSHPADLVGERLPPHFYYEFDMNFLRVCEFVVYWRGEYDISSGIQREVDEALKRGITVIPVPEGSTPEEAASLVVAEIKLSRERAE